MKPLFTLTAAAILCLGAPCAMHAQEAPKSRVTDVPETIRNAVIDRLQKNFVYPQLTIWKFDYMQPYPTEGISVCGRVNYLNSTRRYVGELNFFAHIRDGKVVQAGIVSHSVREDPVLGNADAYKIACS